MKEGKRKYPFSLRLPPDLEHEIDDYLDALPRGEEKSKNKLIILACWQFLRQGRAEKQDDTEAF